MLLFEFEQRSAQPRFSRIHRTRLFFVLDLREDRHSAEVSRNRRHFLLAREVLCQDPDQSQFLETWMISTVYCLIHLA